MKDSVIMKLQSPVKYGKDDKETAFVTIMCPAYNTGGQRTYRRNLKAMLASIITEEAKGQDPDEPVPPPQEKLKEGELPFTPGQVLLTVMNALGDEFSKAIDHFQTQAEKFVLVGGDEPLKSGTAARIDGDDMDMIFATFIANFIMPSLLKSLSGSE